MEKHREMQRIQTVAVTKGQRRKAKYLNARFLFKTLGTIFFYVLLIGISYVILFPLLQRTINAFKPVNEFYDSSVRFIPKRPTLYVIKTALSMIDYKDALPRTLALSLLVSIGQVTMATLAGYGFARFKFKGNKLLFFFVVLTLIVPPQTILVPLYLRFRYFDILGLFKAVKGSTISMTDTIWPMVIMAFFGVGWKSGLYIYMMRQYFKGIPTALEEAAYIDGARTFKTFVRVMLPAAIPMMFTVFLFSFCWQWTDTFYVRSFLLKKKVLATSLVAFNSNNTANPVEMFNMIQTATLIIISPLILLFMLTQRFFVEGIERSGLVG